MSDSFTRADLERATAALRASNAPPVGGYRVFMNPQQVEDVAFIGLAGELRAWRERATAGAIFEHEKRRAWLGRRAWPVTAEEAVSRARGLEVRGGRG
jgi:hypothetical protein